MMMAKKIVWETENFLVHWQENRAIKDWSKFVVTMASKAPDGLTCDDAYLGRKIRITARHLLKAGYLAPDHPPIPSNKKKDLEDIAGFVGLAKAPAAKETKEARNKRVHGLDAQTHRRKD
tara:strand:+ start:889 stop:1248 length:360 start_codon:yes stop_codon:yes gene_type:complete